MRVDERQQGVQGAGGQEDVAVQHEHPRGAGQREQRIPHGRGAYFRVGHVADRRVRVLLREPPQRLGLDALGMVVEDEHLAPLHRVGVVQQQGRDREVGAVEVVVGRQADRQQAGRHLGVRDLGLSRRVARLGEFLQPASERLVEARRCHGDP